MVLRSVDSELRIRSAFGWGRYFRFSSPVYSLNPRASRALDTRVFCQARWSSGFDFPRDWSLARSMHMRSFKFSSTLLASLAAAGALAGGILLTPPSSNAEESVLLVQDQPQKK